MKSNPESNPEYNSSNNFSFESLHRDLLHSAADLSEAYIQNFRNKLSQEKLAIFDEGPDDERRKIVALSQLSREAIDYLCRRPETERRVVGLHDIRRSIMILRILTEW